jgi:hypothetical protein
MVINSKGWRRDLVKRSPVDDGVTRLTVSRGRCRTGGTKNRVAKEKKEHEDGSLCPKTL